MGAHRVAPDRPAYYWTGIGVSIGAGIGLLIGLLGWGADGIALGVSFGAGTGVALGAARDARDTGERRPKGPDGAGPR